MSASNGFALGRNLLIRTDSYKASHWLQYPPGAEINFSYVESRGGLFSHALFFGLQAYLREYLATPVTMDDIHEAASLFAAHGVPFNQEGWRNLVRKHAGRLPIRIRAVPEGSVIPVHQAMLTVENTDPEFYWLTSYLETEMLRAIWYPTTVATLSAVVKTIILRYLEQTSDDPHGQIPFKLHDFGARGVSSLESAALGGMAHLVNFQGTDTVTALLAARRYYDEPMAGFSIPAAEHSTITSWGREHERDAYRNMLQQFAQPNKVLAVVSDSYDIYQACEHIWGQELRDEVVQSGATVVIRPDSGDPTETVLQVTQILARQFGTTTNSKGYRVLKHVRIIQGDGMNFRSIEECLAKLVQHQFSADNIAFGMGGGLLQQVNRDTMKFAMKCSALRVNGQWRDVFKSPVGDKGKASKAGRLELVRTPDGKLATKRSDQVVATDTSLFETVYENGRCLKTSSFAEVRQRASEGLVSLRLIEQ
ncbi:MAG: nicotinate phosphoribosyltransferase [Gemmatales bacterium]